MYLYQSQIINVHRRDNDIPITDNRTVAHKLGDSVRAVICENKIKQNAQLSYVKAGVLFMYIMQGLLLSIQHQIVALS